MTKDSTTDMWDDEEVAALLDAYLNSKDPADLDADDADCIGGECPGDKTGKHNEDCNEWFWSKVDLNTTLVGSPATSATTSGTFATWSKCRHEQKPYTLSDGTVILCSSHHRRPIEKAPDLGCYLDGIWTPDTVAFHIGWRDYGLPTMSMAKVALVADQLLAAARSGNAVEIGCIGGHGRTGTFLAVLDLMTQKKPDAAATIRRVRSEYCSHAIESDSQEWYIEATAAVLRGEEMPPQPVKKTTTVVNKPAKLEQKKAKPKDKKVERKVRNTTKRNPRR